MIVRSLICKCKSDLKFKMNQICPADFADYRRKTPRTFKNLRLSVLSAGNKNIYY